VTTCTDSHAEALLNGYVDGALTSSRQAALFAHLATCEPCRRQFNALLAFGLAARQEAFPVPPAADEAVFARIDRLRRAAHPAPERPAERGLFRDAFRHRVTLGTTLVVAVVMAVLGLALGPTPETAEAEGVPAYRITETVTDDGNALYVIDPGVTVEDRKIDG